MTGMAASGDSKGDMKAHVGTYTGFLGLLKWGTIISIVLAAIVVLLIAS
ncbi:aa3-type cytochrome c oxidase subunit IV [Sphingomonas jatrophae]|uniref:Aa3 type cytochrome c oxidase subunit IV n=1 Tax=Sphingomonas jatrophae TaxID=1166337 RepID=A0A1I6JW18_9SPHN|nr:aa3-type cytochrome c oxidase subunit IV [Sphingomonas jatrophae]SFR83194.1 aa3 type cytochrome c oxidase subunit IV [Sphingomonas jatrophae]